MTPFQLSALNLPISLYAADKASALLRQLIDDIEWSDDFYIAFDRRIDIPRRQAWFADAGLRYRYSDNLLTTQTWTPLLLEIKQAVEQRCEHRFNSVLLTYYRNGDDSVSWHADDEKELGPAPVIASLSLGATRQFCYRHKQQAWQGEMSLANGELILMQPSFQHDWEHSVPSQPEIDTPRINLTFRKVISPEDTGNL